MKNKRVIFTLMITSIALLLVLQAFWLASAYRDASASFVKETNQLFRNTIFAMHDSLIQRSIESVPPDSAANFGFKRSHNAITGEVRDSIFSVNVKQRTARIEIFSTNPNDSITKILRPLVSKLQREDVRPQNFIIRLGPDSLKRDSIASQFRRALAQAGINASFKVLVLKETPPAPGELRRRVFNHETNQKNKFETERVRLGPFNQYAVSFAGINSLLLREITPQILFSLFLTAITIGSFFMMYRSLREQQKLMAIKNDFISNVTHELKTPVATVSVALEALKNFKALNDPQRTNEYLEIAQNELNRLTLMTDKILKTSVFEDKGVDLKLEQVDLDKVITDVLGSMKLVFEKRHTALSYIKHGLSFELLASREHITNVLYNLIDNALKYSPDQSSLEIDLENAGSNMILSVTDKGIGIDTEYQKKIFEKFFRVPAGDIHNIKGYGLGLSYVASVVKSHGGDISVNSELGKGSCFQIVLPIKKNDQNR